jgi:hypothetical protein
MIIMILFRHCVLFLSPRSYYTHNHVLSLSRARVRSLSLFDMWTVSWWWRQGVLDEQESEEDVVLTRSMPAFAFGKVVVC